MSRGPTDWHNPAALNLFTGRHHSDCTTHQTRSAKTRRPFTQAWKHSARSVYGPPWARTRLNIEQVPRHKQAWSQPDVVTNNVATRMHHPRIWLMVTGQSGLSSMSSSSDTSSGQPMWICPFSVVRVSMTSLLKIARTTCWTAPYSSQMSWQLWHFSQLLVCQICLCGHQKPFLHTVDSAVVVLSTIQSGWVSCGSVLQVISRFTKLSLQLGPDYRLWGNFFQGGGFQIIMGVGLLIHVTGSINWS